MLQAAQHCVDDVDTAVAVERPRAVAAVNAVPVPAYASGGRYGEKRRISLRAAAITLAIHAVLIGGLLHLQYRAEARKEVRLITVNLTPDAPKPPPEAAEKQPEVAKPAVVVPRPLIDIPRPAPPMAVTPDPPPEPVMAAPAPAPAPPAPPAPPSIIRADDLGAQMLSGKPPRYPIESRRKHEQGTVVLALTLGIDGAVKEISIARSSGFARLDEAAREAVRRWRWAPITRNGEPVMVRGVVEIPFVLQG